MRINNRFLTESPKGKIEKRNKFWLMLTVFYALFFARELFFVSFPVSFYLIWVFVMSLVFDGTEIKALLVSFVPLVPGFQSKFAILICMIVLIIKYCKWLRVPAFVFIIPVVMIWESLHLGDSFSSMAEYLSGFAPIMCLAVVVSLPDKVEDTSFFTRVFAASLVVGGLIVIANTLRENNQSLLTLMKEGFRMGMLEEAESYQITYNQNGLGFLCNMVVAGIFINIYYKKAKIVDYFLMVFSIVLGCLTVSRSFLLCLAGTILLFIFLQKKSFVYKMRISLSLFAIFLFVIVFLNKVAPSIIENYIVRFSADDITGGRSYLFDFYNEFITSSPERLWFGIGIQNISAKVQHLEGVIVNVPHNGYQQMILAWGIIGFFMMMLLIICMVLHARKKNCNAQFMCYLPLILLLTNIVGGQFVSSGTKLLSLVYIYLVICNGGKGEKTNGTENYK